MPTVFLRWKILRTGLSQNLWLTIQQESLLSRDLKEFVKLSQVKEQPHQWPKLALYEKNKWEAVKALCCYSHLSYNSQCHPEEKKNSTDFSYSHYPHLPSWDNTNYHILPSPLTVWKDLDYLKFVESQLKELSY